MAEREAGRGIIQRVRLLLDEAARAKLLAENKQTARAAGDEWDRAANGLADFDVGIRGAFPRIEAAGKKAAAGVESAFRKASASAGKWFNETAKGMIASMATMFAIGGIARFGKEMWQLGTDAEETASKFETTFGEMSGSVQGFLDQWGAMAGLNKTAGREMTATSGAIVQGMGASRTESAKFSEQMVRLAGDLQSFHNVPIADTFTAIKSGLVGAWEPMDRFGIVLRQVDVDARAFKQTGKTAATELTALEKATAALSLMLERAGPAMGDLDRTQDSTANTARRLGAEWQDFKIRLSQEVMPAVSSFVHWLSENKEMVFGLGKAIAWVVITPFKALWGALTLVSDLLSGTFAYAMGGTIKSIAVLGDGILFVLEGLAKLAKLAGLDDMAKSLTGMAKNWKGQVQDAHDLADGLLADARKIDAGLKVQMGGKAVAAAKTVVASAGMTSAQMIAAAEEAGRKKAAADAARERADNERKKEQAQFDEQRRAKQLADAEKAIGEGFALAPRKRMALPGSPITAAPGTARRTPGGPTEDEALLEQQSPEMGRFAEGVALTMAMVEESSVAAAETMGQHFSSAFGLMMEDAGNVGRAMNMMFTGLAAGVLGEIAKIAKGKALENLAWAIENTAKGIGAIAWGNAASAGGFFASAKTHLLSAAKWGLVGGGVGALAGAAGYGGGNGAGASGRMDNGRNTVAESERVGPDIKVYLDGFDPGRNSHMALWAQGAREYKERYGGNLSVQGGTGR